MHCGACTGWLLHYQEFPIFISLHRPGAALRLAHLIWPRESIIARPPGSLCAGHYSRSSQSSSPSRRGRSVDSAPYFQRAEVLDPIDREIIEKTAGQRVREIYMATEGLFGVSCKMGRSIWPKMS